MSATSARNQQVERARQRLLAVAVVGRSERRSDTPPRAALKLQVLRGHGKVESRACGARRSMVALRDRLFFNPQPGAAFVDGGVELALFVIQVAASENAVSGTVPQALEALVILEGIPDNVARERLHPAYREIAGPHVVPTFSPK